MPRSPEPNRPVTRPRPARADRPSPPRPRPDSPERPRDGRADVRPGPGPYRLDPLQVDPGVLRDALAGGRLPLAAVRLTILQAMEAELRRRSRPAEVRGGWLEPAGRFLADHADLRGLPSRAEALGWLIRLELEGRLPVGAAGRWDRAIRFLYDRVLAFPDPGRP